MGSRSVADVVVKKSAISIAGGDDEEGIHRLPRYIVFKWVVNRFARIGLGDMAAVDCTDLPAPNLSARPTCKLCFEDLKLIEVIDRKLDLNVR